MTANKREVSRWNTGSSAEPAGESARSRSAAGSLAGRLAAAGVTTTLLHYEGVIHGFLWMGGAVDECRQMAEDVAVSLHELWG